MNEIFFFLSFQFRKNILSRSRQKRFRITEPKSKAEASFPVMTGGIPQFRVSWSREAGGRAGEHPARGRAGTSQAPRRPRPGTPRPRHQRSPSASAASRCSPASRLCRGGGLGSGSGAAPPLTPSSARGRTWKRQETAGRWKGGGCNTGSAQLVGGIARGGETCHMPEITGNFILNSSRRSPVFCQGFCVH